jgi:hypothetical protein
MRAFVASLVASVLLLTAAQRSAAAPDYATALATLKRGVKLFRSGAYREALEQFTAAQRLAPDKPNPYRWLALTQVQLGDCPAALENVAAFRARVAAGDPRLAELLRLQRMCSQTGILRVESTPSRADLRIDGRVVGRTPYVSLSMGAGEHTLTASKSGHRRQTRRISLDAGRELEISLELQRSRRGLSKRWWFWPVVVGSAAAVAGITVFALRGDDGPTMLPGVQCDDAGCR